MKLLHAGPPTGPHLALLDGVLQSHPDDNVVADLPDVSFATLRREVGRHQPQALVIHHWDRGLRMARRAVKGTRTRVFFHRYVDAPLKAGFYKRAGYNKLTGFVTDSAHGRKYIEAAHVRRPILEFHRPVTVPEDEAHDADTFVIGIPSFHETREIRADLPATLAMLPRDHRVLLFQGTADAPYQGPRFLPVPWAEMLQRSDVILFLGEPQFTYPTKLVQARAMGIPCLVPGGRTWEAFTGIGVECYERLIPNHVASLIDQVETHGRLVEPVDTDSYDTLMDFYRRTR